MGTQRDMFDTQIEIGDQLIEAGAEVHATNHQHRVTTYTNNTGHQVIVKTSTGEYTTIPTGTTITANDGEYLAKIKYPTTGWNTL